MKVVAVTKSGRSYTVEISKRSIQGNHNSPIFDFVCDVTDERGRPILEYPIPSNQAPYFARWYKSCIPEFLKNAAKMFIGIHEQKIALGLVK